MSNKIRSIAVLTSGGDSPGMNAATRAVVKQALASGIKPYLVYEGYKGLNEGNIKEATASEVDKWLNLSGTAIYSARYPKMVELEVQKKAAKILKDKNIDALVVIGGDGSFQGAAKLSALGVPTIGLPGTIDNDIASTEMTIGFDSALNAATTTIQSLRDTLESHNRVCIVEVMGRNCPDIAVFAGYTTGAEVVVTQDNIMKPQEIIDRVKLARKNGHRSIIVLVSEHLFGEVDNLPTIEEMAKLLTENGFSTRTSVLGHIQRGWAPTALEKASATRMGIYAVQLLQEGQSMRVVGIDGEDLTHCDIQEAVLMKRRNRKKMLDELNSINIL